GNKSSTGITIAYYFSTDTIIDGSDQTLGTTYISSIAANYSTITNKSITIPSSLSPGIYYILFFADSFDNVNETREDNNIVCLPIYITVPTIDIYAQTAYLSSYFVATGSSVSMYTYLQNIGTATAASCRLGYYLSADTIWDSGDTLLSSAYSSSIAGGGYYNATRTITIPSTITPGTWYLFMYADDLHAITESSEANNLIYKTVNLIENGSDLHMMNTSLSASTVFAGNSLYAYGTIRNGGNSSATSSNVGYYLSHDAIYDAGDVYLGNYLGSSLNAFATSTRNKTLTIPGGTLVGQYYLLQFADYSLVVDELDETNNVAADLIYVDQPSIDLMILSPTATPTSTSPGSIVSASCYIYNAGSSPSTSSNVGFYLSANQTWDAGDVYLGYAAGGTLNGSSQATRSGNIAIPGGTASGTWYILYFADYGETVDETDETNNVAFQTISVSTPYIDLTIATPQTTSATIAPGSSVTAYCYIANSGNTSASSSYVGYYLSIDTIFDGSDVYLSASTGGALAAGSQAYRSATITIPVSTTLGAYYVLFFADYQYYVSESIETNNVAWYAISVSNPAPDLTITTGSTSASTVLAGNSITGYATIQNIGSLSASSSQVGYYLSTDASWDNGDVLLTTSGGGTLNAGAQTYKNATLAIPGTTAGGNYYILFFADYAYLVTESNENNNVFAYPITVTAPGIDLIISGGSATPSSTVSGAIVAVSSTIQNIGTTAATYSYVGFYLSTDNIWDGGDQLLATVAGTNLASGASAVRSSNVTIPGSTAAGNYYILCYADNSNYVTETNEANNIYAISLAILPQYPDLLISSATIFPDTLEPGEQTALNYTISNAGYASASTSYTAYYISADTIWDQYDTYLTYYAGGSIIAGGTLSKSENLTIPTSISSGNYYILVYTDFIGYVNESNESNNVRAIPLTIEQLLSPDLMISSSALTSSTVDAGGSLNAMCYVKNQGTAASSQSMLAVYLSSDSLWTVQDNILGYAQTDALLPLEMTLVSQDIAIPLSVPDGDYFIIFKADFQNAISESNEYNNTAVKPLHVNNAGSTVDFSIETPTATPSPVAAGQKLYLSHVLKNNGTMTASIVRTGYYISDNATLEVGDDLLGSKATTGLAGGSSVTISDSVTIPSGMTGGTKYLIFAADYDYAFSETDENNNLASIQTEITGIQPDLEIVASSASTTQITAGDAINFSFTVKNSGDATSTVGSAGVYLSYDQTFQLSDQLLSSFALQQLAAGASQMLSGNLTIPQTVAGGDYYLIFFADDEESISEISEYNNTSSLMISVAAYGDEMIVPVAGSLAYTVCSGVIYDNGINNDYQASSNGYTTLYPGVTGNKIRITFTEFTTDLCCDILYIYNGPTTTSPLIGAYLTNPGAIEATNIDGALTLKFVSDASNQTSGFAAEVECASPGQNADLGISNLYMLSNVATADEYYPITSRIINSGGLDAQAFTVGYFLSSDSIFDISDVLLSESNSSGILQGQVEMHDYDLWLPPSLNAGDYYLIVYADMNDVVPENIETNNVKTVAITVLPATEGFAESSNTDSFIVFPNPAIGEVFVKLLSDNQKETSIILFNSLGQTVQKCTFEDSEILRIPLPAPGMYLLEIRQGNNRTVKKIIAE
ncbi:MAG: T9SS type A sorting domain-containing protein, partial [Bacteroidetes bacterium]|nr:T9SS type A sorting domain-containing protein [Bacteroidota bacterium]